MSETIREPHFVLELTPAAGAAEIKAAYRRLARRYHPDLNPGDPETAARFLEVCEAYQSLTSRVERQREAQEPEAPLLRLPVPFLTAYQGGEITVELPVAVTCKSCGGLDCDRCQNGKVVEKRSFTVAVPRGVVDGTVLAAHDQRQGRAQAPEILVAVEVAASNLFSRLEGYPQDLLLNLPVSPSEAALGATVRVPTPAEIVSLVIPPGTQSGKVFRVQGRGMPKMDPAPQTGSEPEFGNLIIRVQVVIPAKLSTAQTRAFEELRRHDDDLRGKLLGF